MRLVDVLWLCQLVEAKGLGIWIDGGWGVDALLHRQTRAHNDLDIVVEARDCASLVNLLSSHGFVRSGETGQRTWNFVMEDGAGRKIDFHVIEIDAHGNGIYGPVEAGEIYPASALAGRGQIGSLAVSCIGADYQVVSHNMEYDLRAEDISDMTALCDAYGLELPARIRSAAMKHGD